MKYLNVFFCGLGTALMGYSSIMDKPYPGLFGCCVAAIAMFYINHQADEDDKNILIAQRSRLARFDQELNDVKEFMRAYKTDWNHLSKRIDSAGNTSKIASEIAVLDERLKRVENQTQFFG